MHLSIRWAGRSQTRRRASPVTRRWQSSHPSLNQLSGGVIRFTSLAGKANAGLGMRSARSVSLYNRAIAVVSSEASKLTDTGHFGRLAGTGIVVLGAAGVYLYLGGWFSPGALTPARFANGFERVDGIHSGFRLNHAKGVCVNGSFESNGRGMRLSKAAVFKAGRVPIIGRFSLAGGNPHVADTLDMVRGLGLLFKLPDGEEWRTAMINTPVFGVHTPQGFYDRLLAAQPDPQTGKPDPQKMAAFLASHPEAVRAAKINQSHSPSSGFDNTTFYGLP